MGALDAVSLPSCCICYEEFVRDINPPVSCVPCGHEVCRPCLDQWAHSQRFTRKCPLCRVRVTSQVPNRALMDLIESSRDNRVLADTAGPEADTGNSRVSSSLFVTGAKAADASLRRRSEELIRDDSERIFCVIDNSGSMRNVDGKIFVPCGSGRLRKRAGGTVTRWEEAGSKCLDVAEYNVRRGVPSIYYLLNPRTPGRWVLGEDFVEIVADTQDGATESLSTLRQMLDPRNVRGTTPLEQITRHLRQQLSSDKAGHMTFCYVIFTDGEPNSKYNFELELRGLACDLRSADIRNGGQSTGHRGAFPPGPQSPRPQSLFLTVNLCTDQDDVVEYYNDLDQKLGNELSGMDVLDDLEAEQKEVVRAGNNFLTYCQSLHVCRMAGCHSVLADLLDERPMAAFHVAKLVKEVLKLDLSVASSGRAALATYSCSDVYSPTLWLENTDAFLELVRARNYSVFDFRGGREKLIINVEQLRNKIWWYKFWQDPFPASQRIWSCRVWLEDAGWARYISMLWWPILVLLLLLVSRLDTVRRILWTLLPAPGADEL